jgi:hypothetical protein
VPLDINTILQHANDKDAPTHRVKDGQTLEEIAMEHFGDARYADLIFRMNLNQIPAKFVGMRKLRIHLLPHTKLRLPSKADFDKFMESGLQSKRRTFEYEERRKRQM